MARHQAGAGDAFELLRRLAYWLMKEPDLEENDLRAAVEGDRLIVARQSLEPDDRPITVTLPDGTTQSLTHVAPVVTRPDGFIGLPVAAELFRDFNGADAETFPLDMRQTSLVDSRNKAPPTRCLNWNGVEPQKRPRQAADFAGQPVFWAVHAGEPRV